MFVEMLHTKRMQLCQVPLCKMREKGISDERMKYGAEMRSQKYTAVVVLGAKYSSRQIRLCAN